MKKVYEVDKDGKITKNLKRFGDSREAEKIAGKLGGAVERVRYLKCSLLRWCTYVWLWVSRKYQGKVKEKTLRSDEVRGTETPGYWLYILHRCWSHEEWLQPNCVFWGCRKK